MPPAPPPSNDADRRGRHIDDDSTASAKVIPFPVSALARWSAAADCPRDSLSPTSHVIFIWSQGFRSCTSRHTILTLNTRQSHHPLPDHKFQ